MLFPPRPLILGTNNFTYLDEKLLENLFNYIGNSFSQFYAKRPEKRKFQKSSGEYHEEMEECEFNLWTGYSNDKTTDANRVVVNSQNFSF